MGYRQTQGTRTDPRSPGEPGTHRQPWARAGSQWAPWSLCHKGLDGRHPPGMGTGWP